MMWEYLAINLIEDREIKLSETLNNLGEDGWELIYCSLSELFFIFKRPKSLDIETEQMFDEAIEGYFGGKVG